MHAYEVITATKLTIMLCVFYSHTWICLNFTRMSYRCKLKLRRRVSNPLDMLQDSQGESSLVYSSQQMSV